ncbi:Aste57867_9728 [Aphanomyces stellatus]|uniref:Aste57867_9728 protein n=1 Tax=Aphanomyces stellatus TaxID=120398 RepID=A0A485KNM1_9STRA|nr:hypothetical protein As57867_009690 [Aphanomyces stellatus]VFT86607.1 Aste57867_9728 [Aphanomyces stellatus]
MADSIASNNSAAVGFVTPGDTVAALRLIFTILSILGCVLVVLSYLLFLPLRKGTNALVVSIAICAMGMHITMLAQTGYAGPNKVNNNCESSEKAVSILTQFFVLGQEMYLFMMILDLYSTTRNPFTYTRTSIYHLVVLSISLLVAYIFSVNSEAIGFTELGICWFKSNSSNASVWLHIYFVAPLAFLYGKGFMLFIVARNRIQDGYDDITTSAARILSLRHMRVYIVTSALYWIIMGVGSIAILFWMNLADKIVSFYEFWMLGLSLKGTVIFVLYSYLMKLPTIYAMWRQGNYDDLMNIQGVQWVLRRDVLYFARMGICESISSAVEWIPEGPSPYAVRSLELIGRHESHKAIFHEFEAASFALIRSLSGITSDALGHSMRAHTQERFSEGKSGAFLYYTGDQKFIVKTCTEAEQGYLMQILPAYIGHLQMYPNSFLSRYVGCYELIVYDQTIRFIVLANILQNPSVVVDEFYDLKGSWVGRYENPHLLSVRKVCKHCGKEFVVGKTQEVCQMNPSRKQGHVQDICGKDLNWGDRQISLHEEVAEAIADQLATDSEFLRSINSIDYSLIVGLHTTGGEHTMMDAEDGALASSRTSGPPSTARDPYDLTLLGLQKKHPPPKAMSRQQSTAGSAATATTTNGHRNSSLYAASPTSDTKATGYLPISSTKAMQMVQSPASHTAPTTNNECVVYMGIIDILTPWSVRKQIEHWFRIYIQCLDRQGISCVEPTYYAERFRERVVNKVIRGQQASPNMQPLSNSLDTDASGSHRLNLKLIQPQHHHHAPDSTAAAHAAARNTTLVASDFTGSNFVWDHRPSSAKSNMSSFPSLNSAQSNSQNNNSR